MKLMSAFVLALMVASGAALAQGGTETGTSGMNTGKDAIANPTPEECARGWDDSNRMSEAEFNAKCEAQ